MFLESTADIAIFGGSAGSGKSYAMLLEPMRNLMKHPAYSAVIFRRSIPSVTNPGGLWDQSLELYGSLTSSRPTPREGDHTWFWPDGSKVRFAHLEHENTVFDWHGAQVPLICFDELTEFTEKQFFYMLSRNRSTTGVKSYMRATCNPNADSWVKKFIAWWIDEETGFPIKERAGKLRWFVRVGNELRWASNPKEFTHKKLGLPEVDSRGNPIPILPKSVTFIPAKIYDNPELLRRDPGYLANLLAQSTVERERLLEGNWKIRPSPGMYFNRSWVEVVDALPAGLRFKRGWDLAATKKSEASNPDATCSTKIGMSEDKTFYVVDHTAWWESPGEVEKQAKNISTQDGKECEQNLPQDPGAAGKSQVTYLSRALAGCILKFSPERGDKVVRFSPFSSQCKVGNVKVLRGPWNERWFSELEGFPPESSSGHDDDADSTARAFNAFFSSTTGLIEHYQAEARRLTEQADAKRKEDIPLGDNAVRIRSAHKGVNVIYDIKGLPIFSNGDGVFVVTRKHFNESLKRAGFTEVESETA